MANSVRYLMMRKGMVISMIRYIQGVLVGNAIGEIIVDNQGIGYAINVPVSIDEYLPSLGEEVKIYTYFSVREDAMQLYGFINYEDLQMFKLLISVNGVGPKVALGIMGTLSSDEIRYAVMAEDEKTIAKAPGIGAKSAKKVILELKDKIDLEEMLLQGTDAVQDKKTLQSRDSKQQDQSIVREAIEALVVLGYSKTEATKAVKAVELTEGITVEELLKQSLMYM